MFDDKITSAILDDREKEMRNLLKGGIFSRPVSPNYVLKRYGRTALTLAIHYGMPQVVKVLLQFKADVNLLDQSGDSPLTLAAYNKEVEISRLLLANGANPNVPDKDGKSPLQWAAQQQSIDIMTLLLARGANVNQADEGGSTPLDAAVDENYVNCVSFLLKRGAAVDKGKEKGAKLLCSAARQGSLDMLKLLLAQGMVDINTRHYSTTPLIYAAFAGQLPVVKYLIEAGADPSCIDSSGTARENALKNQHFGIVAYLDSVAPPAPTPQSSIQPAAATSSQHVKAVRATPTSHPTFVSLEAATNYIRSFPHDTEWPVLGNFVMQSEAVGSSNRTVFRAFNKKKRGKSYVVKLTEHQHELDFIEAINALDGVDSGATKHLVECFEWGPVAVAGFDCLALVMEAGRANCHETLRAMQDDEYMRLRCIDHIASAVGFLHRHEYVHGDLKLENVMDFGSFKLIDFDTATRVGQPMAPFCTKPYCPPELARQIVCRSTDAPLLATPSLDIWSLGVLVLKLFSTDGVLVEFAGVEGDAILDILAAPGFSFQASLRAANLTGRQRKYLSKCLEPDVAKRAPTVADILKLVKLKTDMTTSRTRFAPPSATLVPALVVPTQPRSAQPSPCIWLVDADPKHLPVGWEKHVDRLRDVTFHVRFQCESHADGVCATSSENEWLEMTGGSESMRAALPILAASALLLKGLTLASYYDLVVGDGFEFDFQSALRHCLIVEALDQLQYAPGPRVPFEAALEAMTFRLENEDLEDEDASALMDMLRQTFMDHRQSVAVADAMAKLGMKAFSQLNGLRQVNCDGQVRWMCEKHAVGLSIP
ncbi:Aste57867_7988 [Aphanomyces stellatus]|uniref:Aste57867_7988 protein n=1 Tax=Aphanomyces stellatus TaxID=120398 RepID=A0A485KJ71_9STRA|nr:hypothetical protein As57867_007958 [Aphanomyces stellatus]VFT84881.1 Aste57867_7988 [Aphanomyces stellatus]